jgi:hypothetical protein
MSFERISRLPPLVRAVFGTAIDRPHQTSQRSFFIIFASGLQLNA